MHAAYASSIAASCCGESGALALVCGFAPEFALPDVVVPRLATDEGDDPPPHPAAARASPARAAPSATRRVNPLALPVTTAPSTRVALPLIQEAKPTSVKPL
jgi:hypothetical protein